LLRRQGLLHRQTSLLKECLRLKAAPGVEAVIGRPILLMAVLRPQQGTDGVPAKADQMGQTMTAGPLKAGRGGQALSRAQQIF